MGVMLESCWSHGGVILESWRSHGGVIQTWFGVTMSASGMILDLYSPTSSVESRGVGHTGQRARARGFGRVGARGGGGSDDHWTVTVGGGTGYMGSADPLETIGVMGCALCRCFGRVVRPLPHPPGRIVCRCRRAPGRRHRPGPGSAEAPIRTQQRRKHAKFSTPNSARGVKPHGVF